MEVVRLLLRTSPQIAHPLGSHSNNKRMIKLQGKLRVAISGTPLWPLTWAPDRPQICDQNGRFGAISLPYTCVLPLGSKQKKTKKNIKQHGFRAGRKSSVFGVWAAGAAPTTLPDGGRSPTPSGMFFGGRLHYWASRASPRRPGNP